MPSLKVLKGCLCLFHHHMKTHFVFWLMREFGVDNSWTQLLKPSSRSWLSVLSNLSSCTTRRDDSKFILYNKRDNKIDGHNINGKIVFWSNDYVQSLVAPYQN
ncbi:hypothetical protein GmHk_10G027757 [Glycine max]|nr:hypothetical protein GmHk_10G027757 [Glycine max]